MTNFCLHRCFQLRPSHATPAPTGTSKRKLVTPAVLEKGLDACDSSQLGADNRQCPHPYGLLAFVADALVVVDRYLSQTVRTPPLMISSLARGGKTTALDALFAALKIGNNGISPVIVSFNGNSGFVKRVDETCCEAFLRMVAAQFVAIPKPYSLSLRKHWRIILATQRSCY